MALLTVSVISLLILMNALYVAAEFSAVSVRRSRVRQHAEDGDRFARRLLPYLKDPQRLDRYIAACQIGITISSLVLGAFGQVTLAPVLAPVFARFAGLAQIASASAAAATVLVALTTLQMVLGELVPKSLALQYPTRLALYTVVPMQASLRLLSWFIAVLNGSGLLVLRLLGVRQVGHRHLHSPTEIEYLIAESREGGVFRPDEHERLRRALHLGVVRIDEIMVPRIRISGLSVDTPFAEAKRIVTDSPYTRLPVYENSLDNIIGFVHVLDFMARSLDGDDLRLRSLLRPILVVPRGVTAERVLQRLREAKQQFCIVMDEFGGTAGLATVGDILDEIFGGLVKAPAAAGPPPERLPDGRVRLSGALRLDEAAPWVGVRWDSDVNTIAGAVAEALGHVPQPGERTMIDGVSIEVERVRSHVVQSVLIVPTTPPEVDDDLE